MDKGTPTQLDLFASPKAQPTPKRHLSHSLSRFIRTFEKAVFILMAAVIVAVISFSLGIQRGRRVASRSTPLPEPPARQETPLPAAAVLPPQEAALQPTTQTPPQQPAVPARRAPATLEQKATPSGAYTVQLASFDNHTHAQAETATLKKKGYAPLVMVKGKFVIVCVGSFPDKKAAEAFQTKLKKQYPDSIIRRL